MKKLILTLLLSIIAFSYSQNSTSTYYLSPGFRISWNFKSSMILGLKISIGRMVSEEYYYNITLGRKIVLNSKADRSYDNHFYVDLQTGSFGNYYPLSAGAGVGAAIYTKNKEIKLYPRLTLFGGAGLFVSTDYIFTKNMFDLGFQGVIPVVFNEDYRKFDQ